MTVFSYTMKQLLRKKLSLVLILVVPAQAVGVMFGFGLTGASNLAIGIVDHDNTQLTELLSDFLGESSALNSLEETDIKNALAGGGTDYVLVIDSGFTEKLINNQNPSIRGYGIQETNTSRPVKVKVDSFLSAAHNLAKIAGNEAAFYRGMESYTAGSFSVNVQSYGEADQNVNKILSGMGLLAISMMFLSIMTALNLLEEKKNHTFFRVLISPISLKSYMLQKILCFLVLFLVMITFALLSFRFLFEIYLGPSPVNLFIVLAVFALLCIAMSVALASLTRTSQQLGTAATLTIMPLSMLGGLFWPREIMPEILQDIGQFLPTTWLVNAAGTVVLGNPINDALPALAILIGYTLVFFLLGTWSKKDIAR